MSIIIPEVLAVGSMEESTKEEFSNWARFAIGTELQFMHDRIYIYPIGDDDPEGDISTVLDSFVSQTPKFHVFVHCEQGMSRSVCCAIAWLVKYKFMSFDEANELVKSKRKEYDPFPRYLEQTKRWCETNGSETNVI